ncbi:MAG: TIR domain-containing protein [Planctomycetota bacterium]|jgi:tetratricopeptide (TPR) repeat protein
MKKVFISYSHKDEQWKDRLLPHLQALEQQGDIVLWDDRKIGTGDDWYPAIKKELDEADVAICLISADFLASDFICKEEIPYLKERRSRDGMLVLPVLVSPCPWKAIQWLKGIQMFPRDGTSLAQVWRKVSQEKALSEIAELVYEKIKDPDFQVAPPTPEWPAAEKVDIVRLPGTDVELFGRQKELTLLDEAWESEEARVVSLVAWGGVGKSTLVNRWLELMGRDNYRRAKRVFAWSFYSQGTKERVTSADKFISEALTWFGAPDPTKGSPWDKGQRLADLVRKQKTLLILDGMEPLQSGSDFEKGKIKDPALAVLVTRLAKSNNGLCVITTRERVAELGRYDEGVSELDLDQIAKGAGASLLRVAGVHGNDDELEAASEAFGNHALAINLLGSYLHDIEGHHIQKAVAIPDLDIPPEVGKHPRRVIQAFEKRFGEGPEVQLLRILGLFDRPVEVEAIQAVYSGEPIAGLTKHLVNLTEGQWHELLEKLRNHKLLARKSRHTPDIVDCHPIVREHFGEKLQKGDLAAWRQAHGRLYEYYKGLPEKLHGKFLPDTLEEIQPLFAAVAHGCQADRHQEALYDVYWDRICRKEDAAFVNEQLGAFGSDLSALAAFFNELWTKPTPGLKEHDQATVLNWAGYALRAVGRLREGIEPTHAGLNLDLNQENWKGAARSAVNLSELYLALGEIDKAVDFAERSVEYADRSREWGEKVMFRTRLAHALHQAGGTTRAQELFGQAEEMQKEDQPKYPYLYSARGSQFCDLLLSQARYPEVQKRARHTLQLVTEQGWLLDIALDNVSLGRAYLLQAQKERTGDFRRAPGYLNQAVEGFRRAGQQWFLPNGLLARAVLYRQQGDFDRGRRDLAEAAEIAERGEMRLHLADYHVESARLCLAEGDKEKAREHWQEAAKRVEEMGYHRRDPEVLLIEAELQIVEGDKKTAEETLKKAKARIDEMGCHRWDIEVERLIRRVDE